MKLIQKVFFIGLILLFSVLSASAQDAANPSETLKTFLGIMDSDLVDLNRAEELFQFSDDNPDIDRREIIREVYARINDTDKITKLSEDANYKDPVSENHELYPIKNNQNILLVKSDEHWRFTVTNINLLLSENETIASAPEFLPKWTETEFIGIAYWQIGGLMLILLLALILSLIMDRIFSVVLNRVISKFRFYKLAKKYIMPVSKPAVRFVVTVAAVFIVPLLELPKVFDEIVMQILSAMIPFFLTIIVFRMSDLIGDMLEKAASKTKSTVDDNLVPIARKVIKIITVIFGGIYVLQSFDISIAPLLAGVSIGGLAFALAAQDTVKNLFGSLTIFTDQPFDIGDWIVFDGTEGTVIEVGVRSTRVKTFWDSVISIPNGHLADIRIDNMGRRDYRRFSTNIGVTYDTDPEAIDTFVTKLKEIADDHPKVNNDDYQIHLNSFGEKSINILFYIFFETADWTKELEARHEVMLSVIRAAKDLNIRLAYPIRDYSQEPPQ